MARGSFDGAQIARAYERLHSRPPHALRRTIKREQEENASEAETTCKDRECGGSALLSPCGDGGQRGTVMLLGSADAFLYTASACLANSVVPSDVVT